MANFGSFKVLEFYVLIGTYLCIHYRHFFLFCWCLLFLDDTNSLATIATINQSPFEWHPLSKQDRRKLACLHSALVSFKPEVIRDACIEFRGDILEDFPAGHSLITCWCTITFSRNIRFMSTATVVIR